MLQNAWDTGLLADPSLFGAMVLVALPEGVLGSRAPHTYDAAERVQNGLFHEFKIEVCISSDYVCTYAIVSTSEYNGVSVSLDEQQ